VCNLNQFWGGSNSQVLPLLTKKVKKCKISKIPPTLHGGRGTVYFAIKYQFYYHKKHKQFPKNHLPDLPATLCFFGGWANCPKKKYKNAGKRFSFNNSSPFV